MTISVSLKMQNGKIRVFIHNNSHLVKIRRTSPQFTNSVLHFPVLVDYPFPFPSLECPSPKELPFPPAHWLSSFHKPDSVTKYEINSSNGWKSFELSQPNKAQLLAEDSEYERIASQGTIDPSYDTALALLDKFTKISLDAYWHEIVLECREKQWREEDEAERNAEPNIY